MTMKNLLTFLFVIFAYTSYSQKPAAEDLSRYIALLEGKKVGLTANHTTLGENNEHLLDILLKNKVDIVKIYSPEHGFRGTASEGEIIGNSKDSKTGIPIISLYGDNKKPTKQQVNDIDCMVFDMQDVGTRFYTYLSTMHYVMEACAENNIPLVVLDRPNPNGFYIDGPVLEPANKSFIGMHKIPVVHGMTLGELALMINGEKWLAGGIECKLTVIPCVDYTHKSKYRVPVAPSPNLPDMQSIYLYPSLCLFEGTPLSVGRGTAFPFQVIGHPYFKGDNKYPFSFTPKLSVGKIKPLLEGKVCYGKDFRYFDTENITEINLDWIIEAYNAYNPKNNFFKPIFRKLAGNNILQQQIAEGKTAKEIKQSWKKDLDAFKIKRQKYLLYN
jgi:uncharacterized protein YbbC (DUF1343 family)